MAERSDDARLRETLLGILLSQQVSDAMEPGQFYECEWCCADLEECECDGDHAR